MQVPPLHKSIQVLLFAFLLFSGLYYTKSFLVPVTIAGLLAMLFLPITKKIEKRKVGKGWAALIIIILLLALLSGIIYLLSWQMSGIAEDASKIEAHLKTAMDSVMKTINKNLGISTYKQREIIEEQTAKAGTGSSKFFIGFVSSFTGILINFILVLVYLFLFLYFRGHIKNFILKLAPAAQKENTENIIQESSMVAQKYLTGLGTMIVMLWVMYGIGFSIVGVKSALFFAVLCGILEIIPFVGNLTGTALTLLMVISQGGGSGMVIGVLITYALVQFIQSYIIEPLVVGAEVNINPLFTILVLVIGEMVWGIPGMILAIPLLGIVKIICDNVEGLKPYGFLIGMEQKKPKRLPISQRFKKWKK